MTKPTVTFTVEVLNGKLHFLCSEVSLVYQMEPTRWPGRWCQIEKNVFNDKKEKETRRFLFSYTIRNHCIFLLYDPRRSCHYGALRWWLLIWLLKCRGFSCDSSHSITLLKFATYFVRCTSTRDLFPKLRITLKLIDDNKKPLFCLFYFVHVNFAFRSDQWCAIKLSKARSIYLTKTILSSLCSYHFIQ